MANGGARTAVLLAGTLLGACSSLGGGPESAPPAELEPAGWLEPRTALDSETFADYAERVHALLEEHRLPLDPDDAVREARLAAPQEYPAAPACEGPRGIALLVHGLSDTAFTMRDVAEALAERCFVARTMLLPGHGTRAGDLLVVDEGDWLAAVRHLARQAAAEHDTLLLGGVSLGAVLTLDVALDPDNDVDALLALSPAYGLTSWRLIRWAPLLRPVLPWIDTDRRDDWTRYEAIPTKGIVSTVRAIRHLRGRLDDAAEPAVDVPWMLVQSRDDGIVDTAFNREVFAAHTASSDSVLVELGRGGRPADLAPDARWLTGDDPDRRVTAVTHVGVHVSARNPHYGIDGDYRACMPNTGRDAIEVTRCLESDELWYVGGPDSPAPDGAASARATFNPAFDDLADLIGEFLDAWAPPTEPAPARR